VGSAIVAEVAEPGQARSPVRHVVDDTPREAVHELGLVHTPDHHGVANIHLAKQAAPRSDLEHANFAEGGAKGGKGGLVLIPKTQGMDGMTSGDEAAGDHDGKASAASNEPDRTGGSRRVWKNGQCGRHQSVSNCGTST